MLQRLRFVFALLAVSVLAGAPVGATDTSAITLAAAAAVQAASPERAIEQYSEAIRRNPNDANAYYQRGIAYDETGHYFQAVGDFTDAIRLAPNHAGAHYSRGYAHERERVFDRAIADYRRVLAIDPKDARARVALTRVEQRVAGGRPGAQPPAAATVGPVAAAPARPAPSGTGTPPAPAPSALQPDNERAIAEATEALRRNPRDATALHRRGVAHDQVGQYFAATADWADAIRLAPDYAPAYMSRALAHEREGQVEKALADFRKAAALDPNDARARAGVSRLEQKQAGRPSTPAPSTTVTAVLPSAPPAVTVGPPPLSTPAAPAAAPVAAPAVPSAVAPALAPAITMANPGPRVALVIGNGNYRHATRLTNPVNDATDISAALRKLGFQVVEGLDLDKRGIEDKLREFGRKLAGARLALFFYAGHGMQVAGKNYIVPIDARLEQPGDLRLDTIDLSDVLAQMESEPRVNLIFLDACRDNPLARSFASRLGARSGSVSQGLAMVQSAIGTMIAYATQPDAVALDGEGRNSPFTTALLKHIATPGLDISSVMRRVRADVISATSQRQVPWDHSSLVGDVVLVQ